MIQLPEDITNRDMHQWLNGGWFWWQASPSKRVLCQYEERDEDSLPTFSDVEGNRHRGVTPTRLYAHWPRCGAVNVGVIALYVQRHQQRQYRRTYNSRQLDIVFPRRWGAEKMFPRLAFSFTPDTTEVVQACFEPSYYTYEQAKDEIQEGVAFSRALSPTIIICKSEHRQDLLVYYRGRYAGRVRGQELHMADAESKALPRLIKHFGEGMEICK